MYSGTFFVQLLSCGAAPVWQMHKETDQIETADTYKRVDNPGKPWHIAEDIGYQVKSEQSDQGPVDGADDCDGKRGTVQKFISHFSLISAASATVSTFRLHCFRTVSYSGPAILISAIKYFLCSDNLRFDMLIFVKTENEAE